MSDPLLFELLHQVSTSFEKKLPNDRFSLAFENAIQEKVSLLVSTELHGNTLLPEDQLQKKIEAEVRKAADLSEFGHYIKQAINIFHSEGIKYLGSERCEELLRGLDKLALLLDELDLDHLSEAKLYETFETLSPNSQDILTIAISKFSEGLISDSLAVFSFLTLTQSSVPDYWYRMGIVAKQDQKIELALKSFHVASDLNPQLVAPHIYAAECLFNKGLKDEALKEISLAKAKQKDEEWSEELSAIENLTLLNSEGD